MMDTLSAIVPDKNLNIMLVCLLEKITFMWLYIPLNLFFHLYNKCFSNYNTHPEWYIYPLCFSCDFSFKLISQNQEMSLLWNLSVTDIECISVKLLIVIILHLSVTTVVKLYLALTFCCDFGHVWLFQSLLVESSIAAFMCLLLVLLDSLALSLWLHYFRVVCHLLSCLRALFQKCC